jgi:hypothetical protein
MLNAMNAAAAADEALLIRCMRETPRGENTRVLGRKDAGCLFRTTQGKTPAVIYAGTVSSCSTAAKRVAGLTGLDT